jgi:hypothetical protein
MLDVTDRPTENATLRLVPPSVEPKQETEFDWLTDVAGVPSVGTRP